MKKNNLKITFSLLFIVGFMLFLSFASAPLYKLFCQVTGYGGTPKIVSLENKTNISEKKIKLILISKTNLNYLYKELEKLTSYF